jgi:hypothetical protein
MKMDDTLKEWFSHRFLNLFQSQIRHYRSSVTDRLLPTFSNLENEAEEFEQQEAERMEKLVNPEMDYADFAEIIHDRTIDYYVSLSSVRQGMVNLLTAGLFHLLEQQVTQFVDSSAHRPVGRKSLFVCFAEILEAQKCSADSLPHWDMLTNELRLVANTVKHGPGDSANELAARRPKLFLPLSMRCDDVLDARGDYATSPVAGEGLFLTTEDFVAYASGIVEFWDAFSIGRQ